jgi:low affinity Fe/Cu permease
MSATHRNGKSPACPPRPGGGAKPAGRRDLFGRAAAWTAQVSGGKWAFLLAFGVVLVWAVSGPFFAFSEMWQLVINTGTTIVTFLMVFLIQNAQNRESKAIHIKLDELLYAGRRARNEIINIEELSEEQLDQIHRRYEQIAERHRQGLQAELERGVVSVSGRVEEVEEDVERVGEHVKRVEGRVNEVASKVDRAAP